MDDGYVCVPCTVAECPSSQIWMMGTCVCLVLWQNVQAHKYGWWVRVCALYCGRMSKLTNMDDGDVCVPCTVAECPSSQIWMMGTCVCLVLWQNVQAHKYG